MSEFYPDRRAIARFRWALVDATARDDLPAHWPTTVVAPAFLGDDTDRCPVLVPLSTLPAEERAEWCDALHQEALNLRDTRASLLIAADGTAERLAAHLAQRMVIRPHLNDRPMQWRFFDPGTCLQMPRILGADGMAWLMGPVTAFMVPWCGEWTLVERPATVEAPPSLIQSFKLQPAHLETLSRLGAVNRAAMACPVPAGAPGWVSQGSELDRHVHQAQQHGLTHMDDLVAYALHAQAVHPRIHEHPQMQALIKAARSSDPSRGDDGGDGYLLLTSALTPDDWQRMLQELQNTHPQEATSP